MSDIDLKPCPFCAGEAEIVGDQYPYAECQNCGASFSESHQYDFDHQEAADVWNKRQSDIKCVTREDMNQKVIEAVAAARKAWAAQGCPEVKGLHAAEAITSLTDCKKWD